MTIACCNWVALVWCAADCSEVEEGLVLPPKSDRMSALQLTCLPTNSWAWQALFFT